MNPAGLGTLLRPLRSPVVRVGFAAVAGALLAWALLTRWRAIGEHLGDLGAPELAAALAAVLTASVGTMLSWRAVLADLGSPVSLADAVRIVFFGQLGKYLPGSVWPLVAQMELATDAGVPRKRSAAAAVVSYAVTAGSGIVVAVAMLPFLAGRSSNLLWLLVLLPATLAGLHPAVLNRILGAGLRLIRREPLDQPLTGRGMAVAGAWMLVTWVGYGVQVAVLASALGASGARLVPVCIGAFALAWTAGFLAIVAPAGAGVREAVLVFALGGLLSSTGSLTVAVVSRLLTTAADVVLVLVAVALLGRGRVRALRRRRAPAPADGGADAPAASDLERA